MNALQKLLGLSDEDAKTTVGYRIPILKISVSLNGQRWYVLICQRFAWRKLVRSDPAEALSGLSFGEVQAFYAKFRFYERVDDGRAKAWAEKQISGIGR